jgi:hypothetical protein
MEIILRENAPSAPSDAIRQKKQLSSPTLTTTLAGKIPHYILLTIECIVGVFASAEIRD